MKINEVEKVTGITRSNIRYYEKKELLVPQRGNENNYRLYTSDDIERLKQIKILRMMGISIADIKDIFDGTTDFKSTVSQRLNELEAEEENIITVKNLCHTVLEYDMEVHSLNEELLKENTKLWKQKLSEINLQEKAQYLSRKVSIILCIFSILLCFSPLVPADNKVLNIVQVFLDKNFYTNTVLMISLLIYLIIPILYSYLLHCYLHYKHSITITYLSNLAVHATPIILSTMSLVFIDTCGIVITSTSSVLIYVAFMLLRIFIGFLLLVCYASGDELFLIILKHKRR